MSLTDPALLTAVATVILVAITGYYAHVTKLILISNNRASLEALRPYVIVNIYSIDLRLYFEIKNYGKRPAYEFRGQFDPNLDERMVDPRLGLGPVAALLSQSLIVPGQSISHVLALNQDLFATPEIDQLRRKYVFTATYRDGEKNDYRESYELDLSGVLIAEKVAQETLGHQLWAIKKALEQLNKTIKDKTN